MRAVVQRVSRAEVRVGDEIVGAIGAGLCVLVGVTHTDDVAVARRMASRIWHLRVFDDEAGVMNRSLADGCGSVLVVSQFTLYGDTSRGRRPSWADAAPSERAAPCVSALCEELRALGADVATGRFGARMRLALVNEGPVTVIVEVG
ncbi:MAG: D-tyrosyl-tRNA(Tyr) deacylase [Acidimicrobiia bacterium]